MSAATQTQSIGHAGATGHPAGTVEVLLVEGLKPSPKNPRKTFDEEQLRELAESIRANGVLQPILVRPLKAGVMEIVAGERRWRAAQKAGLTEIPALVREMTDAEAAEAQLVENTQRENLDVLAEAEGYRQAMASGKQDVAAIAARTGKSVKYVYDRVKLLSLTAAAQKAVREGRFTAGHAILLARLSPQDQKRAMEEDDALFTDERTLFDPEEERPAGIPRYPMKPRSVREFQGWIDEHVRLEAAGADPMLFPDLVARVKEAEAAGEKVVRITHEEITPEAAKDGPKLILGRSWKRADGKHKSKTCDRSVIGTVEIGPGRGEVLRVCVDKKHCSVHWGDLIKAAKKREKEVAKAGGTGEDREALRRRKHEEEKAREQAERERWEKAQPAILAALAAAVQKAPAGAGGAVGKLVLDFFAENSYGFDKASAAAKQVPAGKSAEDLVRHMAFRLLAYDAEAMYDEKAFIEDAKSVGVDVRKILAAAAPAPSCRDCGCTEEKACKGGCSWAEEPDPKTGKGRCSKCADKAFREARSLQDGKAKKAKRKA